jgi:serine/threonine protein kinase
MIETGRILQNRYKVERQIGQGGMGAVYIATDERFGSTVAIKETLFGDDKFRKAFEREARLLNSLRHPALPRVSDHFIEGNGQFLVMEFIDGNDLSEQIEMEGHAFPVGEVLGWADQLLDALDYLHSQVMPVIHRDIKPQNLKLTPQGQVVLLDFGLAKGNTTNPESATAAKSVFGYSRNYASLEQIQGTGTDPRSDLYSLAATLYHLVAGNPPVDALTRAMNVLSNKPDPYLSLSKVRPEIPEAVSGVIDRAMSLNADERPASARGMKEMLAAAAVGEVFSPEPTFVEVDPDAKLLSQKTRLQSDVQPAKQSEIRTETFSDQDSRVTKVRVPAKTGIAVHHSEAVPRSGPTQRRSATAGAAIAGVLLLGGGAVSLYVYGPSRDAAVSPTAEPKASTSANVNGVPNDSLVVTQNLNAANSGVPVPSASSPSTLKTETLKAEPKPNATRPAEPVEPERRVESAVVPTPPDSRREPPTGDPGPPPRDPETNQRIPPEVWRKMTPLQRKKLRRALELQRETQSRPPDPDNN